MKVILHPNFKNDESLGYVVLDDNGNMIMSGFASEQKAYIFLINCINEDILVHQLEDGENSIKKIERLKIQKKLAEDYLSVLSSDPGPS